MRNRKAVAPIIATLLMVAIAVVGGILIFVFTQGFFADEQVVGPTVDNIRIFGYDTTDGSTIDNHNGVALACDAAAISSDLQAIDCVAIYIENFGDKPVAIKSVRIFGNTYTSSSDNTATTCTNDGGQFNVLDDTASTPAVISIVDPNRRATICIEYNGSDVKPGRTIPVQVETSNGQSSQINIINGATRGQQATEVVWTLCASEGGTCNFAGTKNVRYGVDPLFATLQFSGGTACTNAVFGDPVPGQGKTCEYSNP